MGLSRVIILIYNKSEYDVGKVRSELEQEGFTDNFMITDGFDSKVAQYLEVADEVWLFGECKRIPLYERAVEQGCEIWRMG